MAPAHLPRQGTPYAWRTFSHVETLDEILDNYLRQRGLSLITVSARDLSDCCKRHRTGYFL